jgi:hypothetical protein
MNFPIGYGMNLEQPQQVAAESEPKEAPAEATERATDEAVACPMPKRKRARVKGGRFAADDPATEKDEAWTESSDSEA